MMLRDFLARLRFVCQKEMLATLNDKRVRFILVMPAIIQGLLFGYAANYNLEKVPYVVVGQSNSGIYRCARPERHSPRLSRSCPFSSSF